MSAPANWLSAFPIEPAAKAVDTLLIAWSQLSSRYLKDFNPQTHEGPLTKKLKILIENHTAREQGLLGAWSAEDVIGEICPATGETIEERRTDIAYSWNNEVANLKLVFEFKRLGRGKRHRDHYLREDGLARFVTGIYSRRQAVAAMVGILLDPEPEVVPPIRKALEAPDLASQLRLRATPTGLPFSKPSQLFFDADFDTEHNRDPELAPSHGHIRVSHFFLPFGYPTSTKKPKKK
jgi:hypothetical protein